MSPRNTRLALLALTVLTALALATATAVRTFNPAAWIDLARFVHPDDALVVVDRHGRALRQHRTDGFDRRWVPLSAIDPQLVRAVLATEDAHFREHRGVDPRALLRALVQNLTPGRPFSGASTLTQQLVKRIYGRPEGLWSKLTEALRAIALERLLTKDEILEQYLNRLPYPGGIEGVARASEVLLGHDVRSLTAAEVALLAGLPQAPSALDPRTHPERAAARRSYVLARMVNAHLLSADAAREANAQPLLPHALASHPWHAARFVDQALAAWRQGTAHRDGSALHTTLELDLQRDAEQLVAAGLAPFEQRGAHNGAAIVLSNATGEVLAYVGAAFEMGRAGGGLDLLRAPRTPGSTLKPLAYALWFERGNTAASIVDDVRRPVQGALGNDLELRNYDGREHGPVSARVALASSYNLAALDVARQVGAEPMVRNLRALGVAGLAAPEHYGPALVLGGSSLTAWDLARLYLALARDGRALEPTVLPRGPADGRQVFTPDAARVVGDILRDDDTRRRAFGSSLAALHPGGAGAFALKTGTSQGWRDAWAAAYDARFTVVVWLGDPAGGAMAQVSGFEAAAPIAVRLLGRAQQLSPEDAPASPWCSLCHQSALETAEVCAWSGLRPGPRCAHRHLEHFAPGTAPTEPCELHDDAGNDTVPARLHDWATRARPGQLTDAPADPAAMGALAVAFPADHTRWLLPRGASAIEVTLRAARGEQALRAEQWRIDGALVGGPRWSATEGRHRVSALAQGAESASVEVTVQREP